MDEVNNNVETKQPVVESLEPVVESLNDEPVETIDSSASVAPATVEPTTEGQVGFLEINSEANTGAPEVAAPEVIKSADSAPDVIPAVEPASEPVTEPVTEAKKEEPPKALETKKNDNKKVNPLLIVLILVLIAVGVAAGFFIAKSLGGKEINNPGSSGSPSNVNTVSIDKVVYRGLTFDIPSSYTATIADNMLSIEDSSGVSYAITIDDSSYGNITSNKEMFKTNFENNGYTTKEFVETDIAGSKYLYLDINNGTNIRTFFRSVDATSTFIGVIIRGDNAEVTDENLNSIEKILSTARAESGSRGITGSNGDSTSYEDIFNILRDKGTLADDANSSEETTPEEDSNPFRDLEEDPNPEVDPIPESDE